MTQLVRKASIACAAILAFVGLTAGLASAAPPGSTPVITVVSPSPAEGATVTTDSVTFAFTYNRKPNATQMPLTVGLVCSLSGPTSSSGACDSPVASGSKDSRSGKSYTGLANGSYTFTVSLLLTDGGRATQTRHFTVGASIARIYWGDCSAGCLMGRANLDGTNIVKPFIAGNAPVAIATDSQYLYYSSGGDTISRANLDGTGVVSSFITGGAGINGIAVDDSHIYWTNTNANDRLPPYGTLGRADLDGTNVDQSYVTGIINPTGIDVDANYIYYTANWNTQFFDGEIGRVALDGTSDRDDDFIVHGNYNAGAVVVDSGHIYWTNSYSLNSEATTIGRANLDGTGVNNSFITTSGSPYGLAVDGTHIYWTINLVPFVPFTGIGRADLDGTNINNSFITGLFHPSGLALGAST